jgi:NAD(P)H-hydrate repair Nnr-like enzyme with NAD(P)H-hydrate dehydratase domain
MLAVIGTVPDQDFPLTIGEVAFREIDHLEVDGRSVRLNRGTVALLGAAAAAALVLGKPPPAAILAGDTGRGHGSRAIYEYLTQNLAGARFSTLTFHYLMPDVDWHLRVLLAVEEMARRPLLIADAGFMYAAKMSGQAAHYDLFTPDAGELAFLADEEAPHPFYTRGFILHEGNLVPDLIARAYAHENAARYLLVKGDTDYLADRSGILATVNWPIHEALEAIGGTGDTLTGLVSGLVDAGLPIEKAAVKAALANRWAGRLAQPTPATQVAELIAHLPKALEIVLSGRMPAGSGE